MSTSLVIVVWGDIYERYAEALISSARTYFNPSQLTEIATLRGESGWPNATACRYGQIVRNAERIEGDYIYLIDADSLFMGEVGPEILADGIVVTTHPGWPLPGSPGAPWERNRGSRACVDPGVSEGRQYHPGAFVGGRRAEFLAMAEELDYWIKGDQAEGIEAIWHDESYLNRYLIDHRPVLVLSGDYCYWQHWRDDPPHGEVPRIVHLDKTPEEFARRGLEAA